MGSKQQKCFDLFIHNDKKGQTNMKNQHITMPALALRGLVIFPGMILHFDIARDRSINAVEEAIEHNDRRIFLVTQIDEDVDEVAAENLYKTGDSIISVDGKEMFSKEDFLKAVSESNGKALNISLIRNGIKEP